jgi:hypothetical protein
MDPERREEGIATGTDNHRTRETGWWVGAELSRLASLSPIKCALEVSQDAVPGRTRDDDGHQDHAYPDRRLWQHATGQGHRQLTGGDRYHPKGDRVGDQS